MRRVISYVFAASVISGIGLSTSASAEVYTKREYVNRDVCYRARKIPALVSYNTRGIKLQDASTSWVGNMQRSGARVVQRYYDEVYIQTREVVEDQHVTLIPVSCR